MNILFITLLLSLVCHVFTSENRGTDGQETLSLSKATEGSIEDSHEAQRFREAVNEGNMNAATKFFIDGDAQFKKYCITYIVGLGSPTLVGLIMGAKYNIQMWMWGILLVHATRPLLDTVFGAIMPGNDSLKSIAYSPDLASV